MSRPPVARYAEARRLRVRPSTPERRHGTTSGREVRWRSHRLREVAKLDRLARSLPDARAIADELTARSVKLNLGGSVHDPTDPVGRLLFNVLAMV
ncbi:MAG: recombinase family protein, partial [Actinomycetota bacterium]|nr:recombinase family protein [Actinomycetota bacterium]